MTDEDFKRIEQNAAEEILRKSNPLNTQQYERDNYHYGDVDNTSGIRNDN